MCMLGFASASAVAVIPVKLSVWVKSELGRVRVMYLNPLHVDLHDSIVTIGSWIKGLEGDSDAVLVHSRTFSPDADSEATSTVSSVMVDVPLHVGRTQTLFLPRFSDTRESCGYAVQEIDRFLIPPPAVPALHLKLIIGTRQHCMAELLLQVIS